MTRTEIGANLLSILNDTYSNMKGLIPGSVLISLYLDLHTIKSSLLLVSSSISLVIKQNVKNSFIRDF